MWQTNVDQCPAITRAAPPVVFFPQLTVRYSDITLCLSTEDGLKTFQSSNTGSKFVTYCLSLLIAMEWNGMEWNGMKWNGMEWKGMERNEMKWDGMESDGILI